MERAHYILGHSMPFVLACLLAASADPAAAASVPEGDLAGAEPVRPQERPPLPV